MAKVVKVGRGSVLRESVRRGCEISAFNGRPFADSLDYIFADAESEGTLVVDGRTVEYKKDAGESLKLSFDDSVQITPIECRNDCIFCFVRQLPKNLRQSLYVRDDDYRLSFVSGCYITCTNLSESDIERIIAYKLSPLYVSVHATDEDLRRKMLGVKKAPEILPLLKRFVESGITLHAQIVLIGGLNDGAQLEKTLTDLRKIGVATVAVVPVGLTAHRENLPQVAPLTKTQAESAIEITERFYFDGFAFCADEMYQKAGLPVKPYSYYGEFAQIENGVGLIAKFLEEVRLALTDAKLGTKKRSIGVFTGISGLPTMLEVQNLVKSVAADTNIGVYPVKNTFFGETVTVTGLVTAADIIESYGNTKFNEDRLLIPSVMLKEFSTTFLDGTTVKELSKRLRKKIEVCGVNGYEFVQKLV